MFKYFYIDIKITLVGSCIKFPRILTPQIIFLSKFIEKKLKNISKFLISINNSKRTYTILKCYSMS